MQNVISVAQLIELSKEYDETYDPSGMNASRRFLDYVFDQMSPYPTEETTVQYRD